MYGDEGIFYADFGDNFTYKEDKQADANKANGSNGADAKTEQKIKHISFPSLEVVLAKRWSEVTSRHFPLDKTFVKHRLLSAFRYIYSCLRDFPCYVRKLLARPLLTCVDTVCVLH